MTGLSAGDVVTSGIAVDDTLKVAAVVTLLTTVELSVEEAVELVATEVKFTFGDSVVVVVEGFFVVVLVVVVDGGKVDDRMDAGFGVVVVVDVVVVFDVAFVDVDVAFVAVVVEGGGFVVGDCVVVTSVEGETLGNRTHPSGVVRGCHS